MSNPVNKVLYNVDQTADTTEAQKAQARANIGAQGQLTAGSNVTIDANNVVSAAGFTGVSATAPIYGNGTADDPLVLHTSHGLSLVQNSEDSTTSLQVTHPVPPPGSTSTNKVLTCVDALENLEWRDIPESTSEVFLAEYGVATVADISAAKNAGKEVFTLIPGTYYSTVAYLREVTRNGASANFASVVSNDSNVKTASVDSSGNWSNSTVKLAKISDTSLVQKLNYGDQAPSRVSTLLIDNDDPEGYSQIKADNVTQGHLVVGPYKGLLDSGIPGVGDAGTPIYIDSNGTFKSCNALSAGYRISINPGANNTTVIANTMHDSVVSACLSWDTLANNYDYDYFWGTWRVHVHLKAFSTWADCADAIHIRINHAYASETGKVKLGSYQVQDYYPYRGSSTQNPYVPSNAWWFYDGYDPYTTATTPDQYGFKFHLNTTTPDRNMPVDQCAHRFIVDSGAPYGDWLELEASVRFMSPNAAPSSNGIYLLMKAKYSYYYV